MNEDRIDELKRDGWVCACIRRNRKTQRLTHIKVHHRTVERCRVCGVTRDASDRIGAAVDKAQEEPGSATLARRLRS